MKLVNFITQTNRKDILGYSIRSDEVKYLNYPIGLTGIDLLLEIIDRIVKLEPTIEFDLESVNIIYCELCLRLLPDEVQYLKLKFS